MTGLGTYCQACTTCSFAPALPERLAAARAASFASSEPSVASRTFLGRGFIFLTPLGSVTAHQHVGRTRPLGSVHESRRHYPRGGRRSQRHRPTKLAENLYHRSPSRLHFGH